MVPPPPPPPPKSQISTRPPLKKTKTIEFAEEIEMNVSDFDNLNSDLNTVQKLVTGALGGINSPSSPKEVSFLIKNLF